MNSKYTLIFIVCSGLVFSACGSDNDAAVTGGSSTTGDTLAQFGGLSADDSALAISVELENDIQAVFGDADNDTTDVVAGDTVQAVIDRAKLN